MILYKYRIDLQSERTLYTHTELTTGDVYAYRFVFSFYSDGKLYNTSGCQLTIKAKRADGVVLTDIGTVSTDGTAYYDVKSDMYAAAGTTSFEVALCTASGGYITTKELVMQTRPGFGEGDVTPGHVSPFLTTLTEKVTQAADSAAAAESAARSVTASTVPYANADSKLTSSTVQGAIDELTQKLYAVAGLSDLTWQNVQKLVRAGLAPQVFSVGDQLICSHTKYGEMVWDIIDFDHDVPTDTAYTHSMSLQLHNPVENIMFCAPGAFYYAADGLAAGTYHIAITTGGESKNYQFTLTKAVPAGGQLRLGWEINAQVTTAAVVSYASASATTSLETSGKLAEGTEGTELTTTQDLILASRFGSNRWKDAPLRRWLNADGAAGAWWQPQTDFDRQPVFAAGNAGFLNGMDADFLAVVGTVTKRTAKSTPRGGGYEDLTERFFLASRSEVYGGTSPTDEGVPYAYYDASRSSLAAPGTSADTNRTHYGADGTAKGFWLRTCSLWDVSTMNVVLPSGSIGVGVYAYGIYSAAPICNVI